MYKECVVYDIDGTITKEKVDLWFEVFNLSLKDKNSFLKRIEKWSAYKSPILKKKLSYDLMSYVVKNVDYNELEKNSHLVVKEIFDNNKIREKAIESMLEHSLNYKIYFSTTNIYDIANIFKNMIEKKYNLKIELIATEIDWGKKKINFFNLGENKIKKIKEPIVYSYGDDIFLSDRELIYSAKNGFLVTNEKNKNIRFINRVNW